MRILGIDPGTRTCGWGVVEASRPRAKHVAHGAVSLKGELSGRLARLGSELDSILLEVRPDVVAVEGVFTHRNARSALLLGHARGVALLCAARAGLPVSEYSPATVKRSVAGNGRAEKGQVQMMVAAILGITTLDNSDAADALAIALCHAQQVPAMERLASSRPRRKSTRSGSRK